MTSILDDVRQLHELNVELMETLVVVGQRFIEYMDKHGIKIEGRENLVLLVGRATSLMEQIAMPYRGNPIKRDVTKSYQNQESLRKMERLNPYSSSAARRFFDPARTRFSCMASQVFSRFPDLSSPPE